ncbi:MAG: hypothetical protein JZU49_00100 [Sulfuricurvum sp.]|nr:hypothetical protein [Sulfuricurvum sp.]
MNEYTEDTLRKVKNFGYLQYSIDKCISILNPEDPERFRFDIKDENHPLCVMYQSGLNTGKYNIDAQEFELKRVMVDSEKLKLQREREVDTMINEFLGYDS